MGVGVDVDLLVVRVAEPAERLLADAGPGGRAPEQSHDRRALGAAEPCVAPRDDVGRDPPLPVGRSGQRYERLLAGHEVPDLHGVADGEDVGVAGVHLVVHENAAPTADREPGAPREGGLRAHADTEHHDVRGDDGAGLGEHLERGARGLPEPDHVVVQHDADAVALDVPLDVARHLGIHGRHQLRSALDQRHRQAEMDQVLRHLEADEAAADHDGTPRRHDRLEPGVGVQARGVRVVPFEPLPDRLDVGHGPDAEDARQVDARQVGRTGAAPGDRTSLS